ncbi:MAG: TraU family protein [Gammaproteobacteria bacterium]
MGCLPIGKPGLLWTAYKNPPTAGDNFAWMLFRKVKCCVEY